MVENNIYNIGSFVYFIGTENYICTNGCKTIVSEIGESLKD